MVATKQVGQINRNQTASRSPTPADWIRRGAQRPIHPPAHIYIYIYILLLLTQVDHGRQYMQGSEYEKGMEKCTCLDVQRRLGHTTATQT